MSTVFHDHSADLLRGRLELLSTKIIHSRIRDPRVILFNIDYEAGCVEAQHYWHDWRN